MSETAPKAHLELIPPKSKTLNQRSAELAHNLVKSRETQWIIDEMMAIAKGTHSDDKKRTMVGLAAPQVGINKRIIVVDVASTGHGENPDLRAYINPLITARSATTEIGREGCFSTGNVCGIVDRAREITIQALNRDGEVVNESYIDFTARIFQHETDHLDGLRFPDRITDDKRLHWVESDQFGDYREHWQDWSILCARDTWESIKTE